MSLGSGKWPDVKRVAQVDVACTSLSLDLLPFLPLDSWLNRRCHGLLSVSGLVVQITGHVQRSILEMAHREK